MRELGAPDNWTGGAGWTNGGVRRLRRPALAEAHRMQQPNGFEWRKGVERPGAAARSTQTTAATRKVVRVENKSRERSGAKEKGF